MSCKGLHRRAGLEDVGQRAVAQLLAGEALAHAGVVAGVVGQRQHLAGLHVQHHHAAGLGVVLGHRVAHLLVGEELTLLSTLNCMSLPSTGGTCSPTSSMTRPRRSLITRREPTALPASCFWKASSTPSCPLSSTLVKPTTCAMASPSGYLRLYSLRLVDALDAQGFNLPWRRAPPIDA
jgi:hypothetical protein